LTPGKPAVLLGQRLDPRKVAKWSIENLDVGPDYTAALAVEVRLKVPEAKIVGHATVIGGVPARQTADK
jgi:hypothetical protein